MRELQLFKGVFALMAIQLTDHDHKNLDTLLGKILDAYRDGEASKEASIGAIAHVVAAAAKDNDGEVKSWIKDDAVFERWKSGLGAM